MNKVEIHLPGGPNTACNIRAQKIFDALSLEATPVRDVASATRLHSKTVYMELARLIKLGYVIREPEELHLGTELSPEGFCLGTLIEFPTKNLLYRVNADKLLSDEEELRHKAEAYRTYLKRMRA